MGKEKYISTHTSLMLNLLGIDSAAFLTLTESILIDLTINLYKEDKQIYIHKPLKHTAVTENVFKIEDLLFRLKPKAVRV